VAVVDNHTLVGAVAVQVEWSKPQHIRLAQEARCQLQLAPVDLEELVLEQ
jgi:hypothetical protein